MTKPKNRLWAVCWKDGDQTVWEFDAFGGQRCLHYITQKDALERAAGNKYYCVRPITIKGAKVS